jgi:hypothetical protein
LGEPSRTVATVAILALIWVGGQQEMSRHSPYAEVEDVKSILAELEKSSTPGDRIYAYWGAVPAVDFYLHAADERIRYGNRHHDAPERYGPELLAAVDGSPSRVWLIFAHRSPLEQNEEQSIVGSLQGDWDVRRVLEPPGSVLYVAHPRAGLQ